MKPISKPRKHQWITGRRWLQSLLLAAVVIATALMSDRGQPAEPPAPRPVSEWSAELGSVYRELAAEQVAPAIRAWERAREAARASRQWQGLLAVGDAYLQIGDAVDFRRAFVATARDTYLEALERAHDTASVEGALGAAAALAALESCSAMAAASRAADPRLESSDPGRDLETRRVCAVARP
jgi:hypothetical protein